MRSSLGWWVAALTLALAPIIACGGDDPGAVTTVHLPETPTSAGDAGASPVATQKASPAPSNAAPSATPSPIGDEGVIVPCGNPLVLLDRQHRLPADCAPSDLRQIPAQQSTGGAQYLRDEAATALLDMFATAAGEGFALFGASGYRSYQTQIQVFANEVANFGLEQALRQSARPGFSEHQLGTTMDITAASVGYQLDAALGDTAEGRWLADHAWEFGFVMSYPAGKEAITGYIYEPWHFRYVGKATARKVRDSQLTLREYLLR